MNAESMYVGGLDGEGMPYIGRVFWSHALKVSLVLYFFHRLLDEVLISSNMFVFTERLRTCVRATSRRRKRSRLRLHLRLRHQHARYPNSCTRNLSHLLVSLNYRSISVCRLPCKFPTHKLTTLSPTSLSPLQLARSNSGKATVSSGHAKNHSHISP